MFGYKDERPEITVTNIRTILKPLGLFPIEKKWYFSCADTCSLHLTIDEKTNWGVYGKGVTYKEALASAYGELMERLQNQILYPLDLFYSFDKKLAKHCNFFVTPDEKFIDIPTFIKEMPPEIINKFPHLNKNKVIPYLRKLLKFQSFYKTDLLCIPYYDVFSDSIVYLPSVFTPLFYGSNGMCAGNTFEEAIVQGISEIFERFAKIKIIQNEINPPRIPELLLQKYFTNEYLILKKIRQNKNYFVEVRDCSLNINLPVIAILLFDQVSNKYLISFGAHPDLRMALNRALTELLQLNLKWKLHHARPFDIEESIEISKKSLEYYDLRSMTVLPNVFFSDCYTFQYNRQNYVRSFRNNRDCLNYLIDFIKKMNWKLLIRNNSYLKFPTFQIIIPGISEIRYFSYTKLRVVEEEVSVASVLRSIDRVSNKRLRITVSYIENLLRLGYDSNLLSLTGLPLSSKSFLGKINLPSFLIYAYWKLGELTKAINVIDNLLCKKNYDFQINSYLRCLKNYFVILKRKDNIMMNKEVLTKIYGSLIVEKIFGEFKKPKQIFINWNNAVCPTCSRCCFKNECSYERFRILHMELKNVMVRAGINQEEVHRLLEQNN
ncbi:MAG TPA: hypothetical protein ENI34_08050 [candidate division WOR-3 bacterium]|uniref:YcaO domain-containing protein n=1 Tax=candidate division WOR-3 bacterium TaxID=2052148 RepID=A0A9C9K0Y6_UNCW3|nr:hypothetical protein [candidate division WOR-3 bacterium]